MYASRTQTSGTKRIIMLTSMWGMIVAAVGGFAAAAIFNGNRGADAYTLCKSSSLKAAATTAIVVDATDAFTEDQKQRFKTTVEAERERLPEGGRLIIVGLNPQTPWEPAELVSVCNPGKAEYSNPLLVTRSKVEKRWQDVYGDPIDKAVLQSIDRGTSERSPIIITIAALLTRSDFDTRVSGRRLVLISDLLEHEKGVYSQLRGGDFWGAYQASSLAKSARLDLRGVSIAVDYLQRGKFSGVQGPRHQAFWERLFKESGASDVTFPGMSTSSASPVRTDAQASQNGRR